MSFEDIDLPEEGVNENNIEEQELEMNEESAPSGRFDRLFGEGSRKYKLSGTTRHIPYCTERFLT